MSRWRKLLGYDEEDFVKRNRQRAVIMQAGASRIMELHEEQSESSSSRATRRYTERDREAMDFRLKSLYFTVPSRFEGDIFRRRYRMCPHVFDAMMQVVANHDPYFIQTPDALGRQGFSTVTKLTCAMRMLAYGIPGDLCDEFLDIVESMAMKILSHFTRAIWAVYNKEYLRRPSKADLRRLLYVAEKRGFPGMVGSLDYMHWQWKICPTSWKGHFTGYKGKPTIILEAAASYDTWIGHAFLGLPGSLNDINVLGQSPLFDDVCKGESPLVKYHVNQRQYGQKYYLVDGIYPKWGNFVKTIRNPVTEPQAHFVKMQEAYRKDVERAFGILQARFAIIKGHARGWDRENLSYIMMTCIILHNMIVEYERDETDCDLEIYPDEVPTRPRIDEIYDMPVQENLEVERDPVAVCEFMRRYNKVRCPHYPSNTSRGYLNNLWLLKHK